MSLMARLAGLVRAIGGPAEPERDAELAAAALLAVVARIDGRLLEIEENRLAALLSARFGLSPDAATRLADRAAELDAGLDPASAAAERIVHDVAPEERTELLAMAYRLAAADGQIHDFEDDLLWRLGRLLGLAEEAIAAIRADVLADGREG